MASGNITTRTNLTTPQPTMLLYAGLSPFGVTDDRKITSNALFQEITANISDLSVQFGDGLGTATVSAAGKGKLRYNDTTKTFQQSVDGGAYASLALASAIPTPASPANSVQYNNAGSFGGNANFLYTSLSSPNLKVTSVAPSDIALNAVGNGTGSAIVIGPTTAAGVSDSSIGVGTGLIVTGDGSSTNYPGLTIVGVQSSGGNYVFQANSRGTLAAPTATQNTDGLGLFTWWGYGATGYVQAGSVAVYAEGNFTDSSGPSMITLWSTSSGETVPSERLRADSSANILFGVNIAATGNESFKFASSTGIATFGKASTQTGQLTLAVSGSANTQSFQAGTSPAANNTYRWPNADPAAGEILSASAPSAGVVTLSWIAAGGSGTVTSVSFTGGLISVANPTTTPALTVAGTSGGIPYFSSTSTWASSALLAANALMIGGGAGTAPATTATGTGVLTALGVNVGSAGAFVVNGGALGTPSSGTLTNATGLPPTTGIVGWPANASGVLTNNGSGTLSWGAGGSGITGTGTNNYLTKWTNAGVTIGDSIMVESGGNLITTTGKHIFQGITISTDATNTVGSFQSNWTLTKNDANSRTFFGVLIEPTFNVGGSNLNTTVNVLAVDTVNTAVTGLTVNLLHVAYNGTEVFSVDSLGALSFASDVRQAFSPGASNPGLNVGVIAGDPSSPVDGDLWYDSTGDLLRARINGATVSLGAAGSPGSPTDSVQFNSAGAFAGNSGFLYIPGSTTGNEVAIASSTITSGNLVSLAMTGTAAASNTKTALRITSSGANATSTQTVYGVRLGVTNTGTSSTNVGLMVTASGATTNQTIVLGDGTASSELITSNLSGANDPSIAFGAATLQYQFAGTTHHYMSTSTFSSAAGLHWGWTNSGTASSSIDTGLVRSAAAVIRISNGSTSAGGILIAASTASITGNFTVLPSTATTNAVVDVARLGINSSGTAAAGFGGRQSYSLSSSTTNDTVMANVEWSWVVATHASRTGRVVHNVYDTAAREGFRIEASGSAPMIGFLGANAAIRQTGGAATAGAAYTATEQAMLQAAYDCLRTFGLLT